MATQTSKHSMNERILDHVGIAVTSLEIAIPLWTTLVDVTPNGAERIESQGIDVIFIGTNSGRIELLAPTRDDSPIARFIENRGPGIHHICYRVADIRAALAQHQAEGFEPIDPGPSPGAGGPLAAFLHPGSTDGVLVELREAVSRSE
jgi:methylmalonyl-CoA/ethylmalonyl-CoA epimerase